jgi:hypothetical protein
MINSIPGQHKTHSSTGIRWRHMGYTSVVIYVLRLIFEMEIVPKCNFISRKMTSKWKYALIGGLASIPLTMGLYWQSGMGNEMLLNAVTFGGLLAGYLAQGRLTDEKSVGFRAGVIGGLPMMWLTIDILWFAFTGPVGPAWFRVIGLVMSIMFVIAGLCLSGLVGLIGEKIGRWLAIKIGRPRMPMPVIGVISSN